MINKICEEMIQVRVEKDYKNYRTLTNILKEYIMADIFHITFNFDEVLLSLDTYKKQSNFLLKLNNWLGNELTVLNGLLEENLENKNYGDFKLISQCDVTLKHLNNGMKNIIERVYDINALIN